MILKKICEYCRKMNVYNFNMNIKGEGKIQVKSKCKNCGRSLVFRAGGKKK